MPTPIPTPEVADLMLLSSAQNYRAARGLRHLPITCQPIASLSPWTPQLLSETFTLRFIFALPQLHPDSLCYLLASRGSQISHSLALRQASAAMLS